MDDDLGGLLEMLDVVITPAKTQQSADVAPSVVTVIHAAEIEDNGYASVAEALQQVPGLYVRDDLIHPNVAMRGVDAGLRAWSRHVKVMINGQPIAYRSDTSNWLGPELIAMDAIARIEVIRGPGSTLYGANAFLGVVNIITKEAPSDHWASASFSSGVGFSPCYESNRAVEVNGQLLDQCSATKTVLNPHLGASLVVGRKVALSRDRSFDFLISTNLKYADRSGLLLPATSPHFSSSGPKYFSGPDSQVASSGDSEHALGAYGYARLQDGGIGEFKLEGHYSEFARNGEFTDWGVLTHENRIGMRNWYVLASYQRQAKTRPLRLRFQTSLAGGGHTKRNRLQIARDNNYWVRKAGGYVGVDFSAEAAYDLSRSITVVAGSALSNDFHDLPSISTVEAAAAAGGAPVEVPSYMLGDVHFVNFSGFGQILYSPIRSLSLIAGASYEKHNAYGDCSLGACPGLNSRLGASYSIFERRTATLYAKLLYGSSFKAPPAELIYGTPYVISGISGNEQLNPQVAHTFEAALGSRLVSPKHRIKLSALVNGFYNLIAQKVEYIQAGNFIRATNSSDLRSIGFESTLRLNYANAAEVHGSFSWQKTIVAECLLADATLCRKQSEFNYLYPSSLLSFGGTYRASFVPLKLSFYGVFVDGRWASQSNRTENVPGVAGAGFDKKAYRLPAYLVMNLVLSTTNLKLFGRKTTVSLVLRNLLNQGIVEPGFSGVDTPGQGFRGMLGLRQEL